MTDNLETLVPRVGSLWLIQPKQKKDAPSSFALVTGMKQQGGDVVLSILICVQPSEDELAKGDPLPFVRVESDYWSVLQDQYFFVLCSTHNESIIRKFMHDWWHDYVKEVAEAFAVGQDLLGRDNVLPLVLRAGEGSA